jgi:hypothetical protein
MLLRWYEAANLPKQRMLQRWIRLTLLHEQNEQNSPYETKNHYGGILYKLLWWATMTKENQTLFLADCGIVRIPCSPAYKGDRDEVFKSSGSGLCVFVHSAVGDGV